MEKVKRYSITAINLSHSGHQRKVRKHINADTLLAIIREDLSRIEDPRADNITIELVDAIMSAVAMFMLKDPSLLAFDRRRQEEPENLHTIFKIGNIPCDSQMRTLLDPLDLASLRAPFLTVFRHLQRGKDMEKLAYYDGHYLLSADGTGFYSSQKVSSPYCMSKTNRNGEILYYQQMFAAAFVHPDCKVVIPVMPEIISKRDGSSKNDCERNAAKRFFDQFRKEHPKLKVIVVEDGLASNGPHIRDLQQLDLRFILCAKPGDHKALFEQLHKAASDGTAGKLENLDTSDSKRKAHFFTFINGVPLNKSNPDLLINILEYVEIDHNEKMTTFSWVTDIELTEDNVATIMRAGRARWRIENETFNTLKNQGYNLGHNYGLGKKNLRAVFTVLKMLAFLIH